MNRLHGVTRERVSIEFHNESWQFDSFLEGTGWKEGVQKRVALPDWTSMLASKGFEGMLNHWMSVVDSGKQDYGMIERNLSTHRLCEAVCQRIQT